MTLFLFISLFLVCYLLGITSWIIYHGMVSKQQSKETLTISRILTGLLDESKKHTLLLWDSVMRGVGASSEDKTLYAQTLSHLPHHYVSLIAKDGQWCHEILELLKKDHHTKYEQIIIFCGGMDIVCLLSREKIRKNLEQLFLYTKKLSPHVIYISPPDVGKSPIFPFPLSLLYSYRSKVFFETAKECAWKHNAIFIDYYNALIPDYSRDKSHPHDKGHKELFNLLKNALLA